VARSTRPQNLEPSHAVTILRLLIIFVKGYLAETFEAMLTFKIGYALVSVAELKRPG
jgi:hypothetical protein